MAQGVEPHGVGRMKGGDVSSLERNLFEMREKKVIFGQSVIIFLEL